MPKKKAEPTAILPIDRAKWVERSNHWSAELAAMARLPCESPEHEKRWGDVLLAVQAELKDIEADRTEITKPINVELRSINAEFKRYSGPMERIKELCKDKVRVYLITQREAEQRALAAAVEAATPEACAEALEVLQAQPESTSKAMRKSWRWQVKSCSVAHMTVEFLKPDLDGLEELCDEFKDSEDPPVVGGVEFERVPVLGVNGKR